MRKGSSYSKSRGISRRIAVISVAILIILASVIVGYYYSNLSNKPKTGLRIALLLPGESNDLSWNQAAYETTMSVAKEMNSSGKTVYVSVVEGLYTPSDITPAINQFGSQGYDLVIGDGFQFTQPIVSSGANYPHTGFLIVGGYATTNNSQIVINRGGQEGFILGVLAELMSKTHVVGIIGGENVSEVTWITVGYVLGAKWVDPNATVLVSFTGNFNDPSAAESAAVSQHNSGADVIFCSGDGISEGVASAANKYGFYYLSNEFNQSSLSPNFWIGGVQYTFGTVFQQALNDWLTNHQFQATPYYATFANGGLSLLLSSKVPSSVQHTVNSVYAALKTYQIQIYKELPNGTLVYSPQFPPFSQFTST